MKLCQQCVYLLEGIVVIIKVSYRCGIDGLEKHLDCLVRIHVNSEFSV